MGKLILDRWVDEQTAKSLFVKNTFLDTPELVDGSMPPIAERHRRRCRTLPSGRMGSGAGSSSESTSASGSGGSGSVPQSPSLQPALALRKLPSLPSPAAEATGWSCRVRRTFLECHCPAEPTMRRSASAPDLSQVLAKDPESSPVAGSPHGPLWPSTPRAEDELGDFGPFCMPVWGCEDFGASACAAAPDDLSWPPEYDQAAFDEEQLVGPGGCYHGGAAVDPLLVIAEANAAACCGGGGRVWALACRDAASSLAVQRAVAVLGRALGHPVAGQRWRVHFDVEAVLGQLRGHVLEAMQSPYAHHVVLRLLDAMPSAYVAFVAEELLGSAVWASKHRFGCRVVAGLVQHASAEGWTGDKARAVLKEALSSAGELCRDSFGKTLIEEVMERGTTEHQNSVVTALRARLPHHACHEHASFLTQRALQMVPSCSKSAQMADELLAHRHIVQALARNQYGGNVLRGMLSASPVYAQRVRDMLAPMVEELQNSKQGKELLADLTANDASRGRTASSSA